MKNTINEQGVENLYTPNCIRTISGIYVNVFEPTPEMIKIEDIAHSLCFQCRFGGHLPRFYSVAQHSLNCMYLIDDTGLKLEALLHDASEAYLLDIPSPIKKGLSNYKEIEDKLMRVIANKFGFQYPFHPEIKEVDEIMLNLEWNVLMLGNTLNEYRFTIEKPHETKKKFLDMFHHFTNNK